MTEFTRCILGVVRRELHAFNKLSFYSCKKSVQGPFFKDVAPLLSHMSGKKIIVCHLNYTFEDNKLFQNNK